jgi:hypothetical protein
VFEPSNNDFYIATQNIRSWKDDSWYILVKTNFKETSEMNLSLYSPFITRMDANFLHLFINGVDLKTKMFIRSIFSNDVIVIGEKHKKAMHWNSIARMRVKISQKYFVFYGFPPNKVEASSSCTSLRHVVYSNKLCMEDFVIETILRKHNLTHVYASWEQMKITSFLSSFWATTGVINSPDILDKGFVLKEIMEMHAFYCHKKQLSVSSFSEWIDIGFDKISWILIGLSYFLITIFMYFRKAFDTEVKNKRTSLLSWLTGISLIFGKDYTPHSNKFLLLLTLCCTNLSWVYLCFVKGEYTAPFHPQPFDNFSQLVANGYKYMFTEETTDEKSAVVSELFLEVGLSPIF